MGQKHKKTLSVSNSLDSQPLPDQINLGYATSSDDQAVDNPSLPLNNLKKLLTRFKKNPLEIINDGYQLLQQKFHIIISGIKAFTPSTPNTPHNSAIPIISVVIQAIGYLIKNIVIVLDKKIPLKEKLPSIALDTVLLGLAIAGTVLAMKIFGFAFGLAAAGIGLGVATIGLVSSISNWSQAKKTLQTVEEAAAQEVRQQELTELIKTQKFSEAQKNELDNLVKGKSKQTDKLESLNQKLTEYKLSKAINEIKINDLKKSDPADSEIKTLKAEIKKLDQSINDTKKEIALIDTDPNKIKKLKYKVGIAKAEIFSNFTGTAIATTGVILTIAMVVTVFTAPLLVVPVGIAVTAIGIGAAVLGLAQFTASLFFKYRDSKDKAMRQENKLKDIVKKVVNEKTNKPISDAVVMKVLNSKNADNDLKKDLVEEKSANDEKVMQILIELLVNSGDSHVPNLTEIKLQQMDMKTLKLAFQERVEKAQPKTLRDIYAKCIHSGKPNLAKYYLMQLREAGEAKESLDKIEKTVNPLSANETAYDKSTPITKANMPRLGFGRVHY